MDTLYGGIELGGTKVICGIGSSSSEILDHATFPTQDIDTTLESIIRFFKSRNKINALGIGTFGPLNLEETSVNYGTIYNTPKPGWANVPIKQKIENLLQIPVAIDLDVNCAALGELYSGAAQNNNNFVYVTIGTGIGGALIINRQIVHGIHNLEMGHMRIPHENFSDNYTGSCLIHGDCFEGIASGHAIEMRYHTKAESIIEAGCWENEANYIALAIINIMMTTGPEKIILGGGVMNHVGLIKQVRDNVLKLNNNYLPFSDMDSYIVAASSYTNAVIGAMKLAENI